jgi:hypothetical protein
MERTDWLDEGFTAEDARFLMATAITHHHVRSRMWDEAEIRKLARELAEIDAAGERAIREARPSGIGL